jgi:hypothetical protein
MANLDQPGLFDLSIKAQEPRRKEKGGCREWYMNFGGWFAHPQEDIDVFVRLPRWRQKELLSTQAAFRRDPTLQASEIYDPRTRKLYPDQNIYKPPEGIYVSHQGPPNSVKYNVPDGITLSVVKKFGSSSLRDAAEEAERKELGYLF